MKEMGLWTLIWTVSVITGMGVAQTSQLCPSHTEISPCSCTLKKSGLDIICEYTDLSHISDVMSALKGRTNTVIFYLRLRHNSLPKLQPYVFLGLDIRHLTIHNSSLAKLEESSLSSVGENTIFTIFLIPECAIVRVSLTRDLFFSFGEEKCECKIDDASIVIQIHGK